MAKYPIKQSLKNLADIVSKQVSQVESDLKSKVSLTISEKCVMNNVDNIRHQLTTI